jgi:hypothetical protein
METAQHLMRKMAVLMRMVPHAQQLRDLPLKILMPLPVSEDTRLLPLTTSMLRRAKLKTPTSKVLLSLNPQQQHRLQVNNAPVLTAPRLHPLILPAALACSNLLLNSLVELRLPPLVDPHHAKEVRHLLAALHLSALVPVVKLLIQL